MTLTGILKSILLVIVSIIIWHTEISPLQFLGYSIALAGLVYYSLGYDTLVKGWELATSWAGDPWKGAPLSGKGGSWSPDRRRCLIITGVLCTISIFVVVGIWQGPTAMRKASEAFPALFGAQ